MIFWPRNTEISKEKVDSFRKSYQSYVGNRWEKVVSARDFEYVVVLELLLPLMPDEIIVDIGGACCDLWYFLCECCALHLKQIYIIDNASSSAQWFEKWYNGLLEKRDFKSGKICVSCQNARSLPFSNSTVDKVVTISALEHFNGDDDTQCAKEVYRVLKPGGVFVGTVDFNHLNEYPVSPGGKTRVYTVESFFERIVKPAGFAYQTPDMSGFVNISDPNYITSMFFKLEKPRGNN